MFFIVLIQTSLTSQIPSLQPFRKLKGLAVQATGEKECRRQYLTFLFNMRMSSCIQLLRIIAEWDSKKSEILLNKRLIVNLFRGKSKEILDKMMKQGDHCRQFYQTAILSALRQFQSSIITDFLSWNRPRSILLQTNLSIKKRKISY